MQHCCLKCVFRRLLDISVAVGGSGIKKKRGGGVATTHRCILRCLTQLGFEALSVSTTLSIASKTGRRFPCEVFLVSEVRTISNKTVFMFFHFFFQYQSQFR